MVLDGFLGDSYHNAYVCLCHFLAFGSTGKFRPSLRMEMVNLQILELGPQQDRLLLNRTDLELYIQNFEFMNIY